MSDEFGEDLVRRRSQVGRRLELLVVVARDPELNVLFTELRLQELAETLPSDCIYTRQTHTSMHAHTRACADDETRSNKNFKTN